MKHKVTLTITSLLSMPLLRISLGGRHRPREGDGRRLRPRWLILVIWLYGTLVLGERRSSYVIMLLGSIGGWMALSFT